MTEEENRPNIERLLQEHGMTRLLGIKFDRLSPDRVVATVQVDHRHLQPAGLLHGGTSIALAESVTIAGAWLNGEPSRIVLNSSTNADHLKFTLSEVRLTAVGFPEYVDPDKQVWQVVIRDESGRRIRVARCTLTVVDPTSNDTSSRY